MYSGARVRTTVALPVGGGRRRRPPPHPPSGPWAAPAAAFEGLQAARAVTLRSCLGTLKLDAKRIRALQRGLATGGTAN